MQLGKKVYSFGEIECVDNYSSMRYDENIFIVVQSGVVHVARL